MAQSVTTITVVPGEQIDLPFTAAEMEGARYDLVGANLQITLEDGRVILLVGFADAFEAGGEPAQFVLQDGAAIGMDQLLSELGQSLEEIQAAAGAAGPQAGTEPANEQASFTPGESLSLIDSLIDKGPVDPTRLQYGLTEPVEEPLDIVEDDGGPDAVDDEPDIEGEGNCLLERSEKCFGFISGPIDEQLESLDSLFLEKQICYPFGFGLEPDEHFVSSKAEGNIVENDDFGPDGPGGVVSVEFNGTTYFPDGSNLITIEDPDNVPPSWTLVLDLNGDPADPSGTGYGDYCFFLEGPIDHSGTDGHIDFVFQYTLEDSDGTTDTANLTICVEDGGPLAINDLNRVTESVPEETPNTVEGNVLTGIGQVDQGFFELFGEDADGPDGGKHVVQISFGATVFTAADAALDPDHIVHFETDNGFLDFDFDDGSYTYTAKSGLDNGPSGEPLIDQFDYTIEDSDGSPSSAVLTIEIQGTLEWSIDPNSTVTEGDTAIYNVSYTGAALGAGETVFVTVDANSGTDPNGADEGPDFSEVDPTVLTFVGGGATSQTVAVETLQDSVVENDETYNVTIDPSAGVIADGTADTTIIDATNSLQWQITPDTSVGEGSDVTYTVSYFGATLDDDVTAFITVEANSGSDPNGATENTDFSPIDDVVLTFTSAASSQTLSIQTTTDTVEENDETYNVIIGGPSVGTVAGAGLGTADTTIIDATNSLQWSITPDGTVLEGDSVVYSVSYSGATLDDDVTAFVTVDSNSGAPGPNGATAGSDFTDISLVLTFVGGGPTSQTVQVQTTSDSSVEEDESYTVTIDPSIGTEAQGTATTTIIDDDEGVPIATDNENGGPESSVLDSNIIIVFDRSGSMDTDPNFPGFSTRLDLEKAAVTELLKLAEAGGGAINVLIVDFATDATNSGWTTVDGAIAYLSAIIADDNTNYDAALAEVQLAFPGAPGTPDQTLLYFLSDGLPNEDNGTGTDGIVGAEITAWQDFLIANDIIANAIGVGAAAVASALDPIAYNGVTSTDLNAIIVADDFDDLSDGLTATLGSVFNGNVIDDDDGDGVDDFGPNLEPGTNPISNVAFFSQSGFSAVFLVSAVLLADTWTVTGSIGGDDYWTLTIDNDTGVYQFTVLRDLPITGTPGSLVFDYTIVDTDGDPSTAQLTINLDDVPAASGLPLIAGDNNANLLDGVGDIDQIYAGDNGNDTINAGGGQDYAYAGAGNDRAFGEEGNDVLVGGSGNDSMGGGNGNDILAGTEGNDTLAGDNGNDLLNGGPDDDSMSGGNDDDTIIGEDGNDTAAGGNGNDSILGGENSDSLGGGDNDDTILGEDGDDTMTGDAGNDSLSGGDDDDSMSGGAGDDALLGNDDADTLIGGAGADTFTGGNSGDDFRWNATSEFGDTIIDFTPGSDDLVFDVSAGTIRVGDDDNNVEGYFEGTLAAPANVDGRDVLVITDDGITDPLALINGGSFSNLNQGTIFVIEDSDLGASGTAVVYYDADPSVAGGAIVIANLTNITNIDTSTFAVGDFVFV